jgi:membrane protein implicated in regulation of membrane protease activity
VDADTVAAVVWIVVGLALFAVEATTLTFVALYFGAAALVAALAAALGASVPFQLLLFALVSVVTLVGTRGMITRALQRTPIVRSNVHALVGRRGVVTVPITAETGRGQIRVGGEYWSARLYMEDSRDVAEGVPVEVLAVEGNAALVLPLDRALTE